MSQKQNSKNYSFKSRATSTQTTLQHAKKSNHRLSQIITLTICSIIYLVLIAFEVTTQKQQYTVVIIGTNDLHGQAFPTVVFRADNNQTYNYGGLVYLSHMIKTIREEFQSNLLYLDGGDQFQGGVQASKLVSYGQIMNDYFKEAGLNASSIGNHEFDFDPNYLFQFLNGRNSTNLAANLLSEKGEIEFLPHHKSSQLFTLPNGVKIGVIGLATIETPSTTGGFSGKKFPNYKFLPYKQIVIANSANLRQRGANAVLIVSHVGDDCKPDLTYVIHNQSSNRQQCPPDQISRLIDELPPGTIDGIVQGHRHTTAHRYYKKVPIMGSINGGFYFNIMYLKFNSQHKLIGSSLEGPIPVCEKIFQNIGQCSFLEAEQLKLAGNFVNWKFHSQTVSADPVLSSTFQQRYGEKMKMFNEVIVKSEILLYRKSNMECQLTNLFTNLIAKSASSYSPSFSFLNTGLFRSEWRPGEVLYRHYFNMFPFENTIQVFQISGKQLIQSMKIVQGKRRIMQAWNLKMQITIEEGKEGGQGRKIELKNIRFQDGSQIIEDKIYKGVTLSYLLEGGDGFSNLLGKQFNPKNIVTIGQFRQTLKPYLKQLGTIKEGSLIDPTKPRIVVIRK